MFSLGPDKPLMAQTHHPNMNMLISYRGGGGGGGGINERQNGVEKYKCNT